LLINPAAAEKKVDDSDKVEWLVSPAI